MSSRRTGFQGEFESSEGRRPSPLVKVHTSCFVCGSSNNYGLNLEFSKTREGTVEAFVLCDSRFEGYPGLVHGGIVSSLLDGAMTNCLFTLGHAPLTAELRVRFCHPLLINEPAVVRAWQNRISPRLYCLESEIIQDNLVRARAWGKFLDTPSP